MSVIDDKTFSTLSEISTSFSVETLGAMKTKLDILHTYIYFYLHILYILSTSKCVKICFCRGWKLNKCKFSSRLYRYCKSSSEAFVAVTLEGGGWCTVLS